MVKKKWLNEFLSDKYVKDANREGFRSRAAFKLLQIDAEFGLFNNCLSVLDLGFREHFRNYGVTRLVISSIFPLFFGHDYGFSLRTH